MRVIIIGAGVAGLSIGWRLSKAGAEVVIVERAQPGRGASWASAGMLAGTAEGGDAGGPEADFSRKSGALWPDFAKALEAASGVSVGYRKDGALIVACDTGEAETLQARAAHAGLDFLGPEAAKARVPGLVPTVTGAMWVPDEAQVDNRALGRALTTAFIRAGGNLQVNEAGVRIEIFAKDTVAVRTPFSLHVADAVVIAAGAWSGEIAGLPLEAVAPVRPVKGEMIALTPPPGTDLPVPLVWGNEIYLVPRGKRLFVGATVVDSGFDTKLTGEAQDWLFSHAAAMLQGLQQWEVSEHWAGLRPGSPDGLPILGRTAVDGVYVASGQYRNGILFVPAIAEAMEALILEGRGAPELAAFDPRRFAEG